MRAQEKLKQLREGGIRFNLKNRLTLSVGAMVVVSMALSFGLLKLLELLLPSSWQFLPYLELALFSLIITMSGTRLISKIFFDPIQRLHRGMAEVADGNLDVTLSTASHFPEIQELFSDFNLMTEQLRATEILQTDFVSSVSHEFKTPITAIEGYSTLLQSAEGLSEEQLSYIEKIHFNTRRLSTLVSNVLLLSKVENQSIQSKKESFNLDELLREVILSFEAAWEKADLELDVELSDVRYLGNEQLLYHVFSNIIGNAIKFTHSGTQITITLTVEQGEAVVRVRDRGPGLDELTQKHMFDKFYQADSSHRIQGNGLGLALVKRILNITGGSVLAENNSDGEGCQFTVRLPL